MALDAFRAPDIRIQGAATQAMLLNASLRSRNAADGCLPPKPFGQPPRAARLCVARPRSTAEGTNSASRLDLLARGWLRDRDHYSDRLLKTVNRAMV